MIAEFSIIPLDKGVHVSKEVAQVINLVEESGLPYQLTSMGTIIEGDWDEVMNLIKLCHQTILDESERVYTKITIDDKKHITDQLTQKITSVKAHLRKEDTTIL